jgi:hypothetical protein
MPCERFAGADRGFSEPIIAGPPPSSTNTYLTSVLILRAKPDAIVPD